MPLGLVLRLVEDGFKLFGPLVLDTQRESIRQQFFKVLRCHIRRIEHLDPVLFSHFEVHLKAFDLAPERQFFTGGLANQ